MKTEGKAQKLELFFKVLGLKLCHQYLFYSLLSFNLTSTHDIQLLIPVLKQRLMNCEARDPSFRAPPRGPSIVFTCICFCQINKSELF